VPPATAQSSAALRAAAEKALAGNPEVAARLNAFQASTHGLDVARAGRGPRLDLVADAGHDRNTFEGGSRSTLNRTGVGLRVTQVLWDGLGSGHEVTRSSHERVSRWFEFLDASEQISLEAVRAAYDVQRFRRLVALAEESVAEHRQAMQKIDSRVKAGVGRGVDLEQAQARLALAESNLVTERSNLHDVLARYLRIVGEPAPRDLGATAALDAALPADATAALRGAIGVHPAISASIETVRAARAAVQTRESLLQPRVELRARAGVGQNYNGLDGRRSDSGVEVVLNWNLFDGGADRGRVREQSSLLGQAMDLRDKTCRDVGQTAAIAFNDVGKLTEQQALLRRNTEAIERAREAYRQQFDIGQRSLLDLLNSENETYTARRALANAEFDRALAFARTHAALGQLTRQLGLARAPQTDDPAQGWSAADDGPGRCPALPVDARG
jgi:adhesin transport system outer membrane protein